MQNSGVFYNSQIPAGLSIVALAVADLNNPPPVLFFLTTTDPIGYTTELGGNSCLVIQAAPLNNKYTAQLAFSFGSDKIAIRRKFNSDTYTAWKYFTAT